MYQKGAKGWLKHFDFMLLDLIVLQLSFLVAFQIRHGMVNPYANRDYLALAIITELADIVAMIFLNTYEGVLRRGHFKEFVSSFKNGFVIVALLLLYVFVLKDTSIYSRTTIMLMWANYVRIAWVDEIYVDVRGAYGYANTLIDAFIEGGITVHMCISSIVKTHGDKQLIQKINGETVVTTMMNYATPKQMLLKRTADIIGGLVGSIFTLILTIFIGPIIYIKSPGPIFFKQDRVGLNGKIFKMYKFRSMYMAAEERKKELMAQNTMSDSKMFKMDFDPRVIGNKILPDGTKKKGIGQYIRDFSIDEFPQFFNVLKGDLSLVGTRPPLISEVEQYEMHHKSRLATKPGITGMWQVSGRSDITDFEEVVRLDTEYIENWSFGLDMKIVLKTIKVVLGREGSK